MFQKGNNIKNDFKIKVKCILLRNKISYVAHAFTKVFIRFQNKFLMMSYCII